MPMSRKVAEEMLPRLRQRYMGRGCKAVQGSLEVDPRMVAGKQQAVGPAEVEGEAHGFGQG